MDYFYVTDQSTLVKLDAFTITPGQTTHITIPTLSGPVIQRGRRNPDTFLMQSQQLLPTGGPFRVVDENAKVYQCIASTVSVLNNKLTIGGVIVDSWEAEQRDAAIGAIKAAKGQS
jgi:hypothetical protein